MAIEHNIFGFVEAFEKAPELFKERVLLPLGERIIPSHFVRISTQEYMQEGPITFEGPAPPRPRGLGGPLRKVSLRLSKAVQGAFKGGSREGKPVLEFQNPGLVWTAEIDVPYARIQEEGGTITVNNTAGLEAIFWAKMYDAIDHGLPFAQWRALALTVKGKSKFVVEIPARPYLEPAMEDTVPIVVAEGEKLIVKFMNDILPNG